MTTAPRATVCLSLDFDVTSIWLMFGLTGARALSRGEFGATTGAPRLLDLCDRLGITATWFVPGHTADNYPGITTEVHRRGHELGNHGYVHEDFGGLSLEESRAVLRKGNDALERITGRRPRGVRLTGGDFDGALLEVVAEEGFTYDSSLIGEYRARWARGRDTIAEDGAIRQGAPLDLVELPIAFLTSDFVYFELDFSKPEVPSRLRNPRDLEDIWRQQFDYLYEREPGGYLMLMLHPQVIGWGLRAQMLERFLEYCRARPGTRFATCETVADEFRGAATSP